MEKIIPVSVGEEIKRPLAREKNKQKLMSHGSLSTYYEFSLKDIKTKAKRNDNFYVRKPIRSY